MTIDEINAIVSDLPQPPDGTKCGWTEWAVQQPSEALGTGWTVFRFAYALDEKYGGTGLAERIELREPLLAECVFNGQVVTTARIASIAKVRMANAEEAMRRAVAHYVANALVNPLK